jgi:hypothetical protein
MDINQLNEEDIDKYFKAKYIKYKSKYLALKQQKGGLFDIGKAWNTSVQFVQENVIEKPVNYVTEVTQQLTPQELTPEENLRKEIEDLQQQLNIKNQTLEQINKIKNKTDQQITEWRELRNGISKIEIERNEKNEQLKGIMQIKANLKYKEEMAIKQHQNRQEAAKRQEEKQIEAKRIRNNEAIIEALSVIIKNDKEIFQTYIKIINLDKHNSFINTYYTFANFSNQFSNVINKPVDFFNNIDERREIVNNIINYIFTMNIYHIYNFNNKKFEIMTNKNKIYVIDFLMTKLNDYMIVKKHLFN